MLMKIVQLILNPAFKLLTTKMNETFKLSLIGKELSEHVQIHSKFLTFYKCYVQIHDKDKYSSTFFTVLRQN